MGNNIARTGKVKVPKWGVLVADKNGNEVLEYTKNTRRLARQFSELFLCAKVVRLEGTVTYTLDK